MPPGPQRQTGIYNQLKTPSLRGFCFCEDQFIFRPHAGFQAGLTRESRMSEYMNDHSSVTNLVNLRRAPRS